MQSKAVFADRKSRCQLMARNDREICDYITLHSCVPVTDEVKINEQNKSIATGLLYVCIEFEPIWRFLPGDVAVLNPTGYRTL